LAIYRGAGGAGDAVGDASSEVLLALQAKDAAQAAQAAAELAQVAAETAETNAETAETNAETAETNAETAATNASNSASAASTSASNASTSATNASNSASAASTSATNASNSASAASTSATNASNSASAASTSASNASTSASNAATSATNAANAQTAAETARDQTLTAYDNFDDRYLGSKTSDPTLDNDGNALVAGSLYFNSVSGAMKVYTGSAWVDAYSSGTTFLTKANNLSDLTSVSTARTNLGLVASATTDTTNASNISSGTLGAARLPAFSGDATSSAGTSALTLATVNSNTGSFGSSTAVPVITVNGKGLITAVSTAAVSGSISVTGGDLTLSGNTGTAITNATLATVNSNTGSFGSATAVPVITVNGKGLITAISTASVQGGAALSNDTSTASDLYPMFAAATSGTPTTVYTSNAKLLYKPSTGELKASQLVATNGIIANSATISADYTIASGQNAMSTGAVTVNSGVTVTVSSGSRWVVL
jgi:hypothetical protein